MEERYNRVSVNFKELYSTLLLKKWLILGITFISMVVGIIYALTAREEFVSEGRILPEVQSNGGGFSQFSGLAALAGVDLNSIGGSGVDAIRPDLYPNVVTSTPFYLELLKELVVTKENKKVIFEDYYFEAIDEGKTPKKKLLNKYPVEPIGIIVINGISDRRLEDLRERVTASIDNRTGIISISTKMPDPVVAAKVTSFAMMYLMRYIENYRTEKLKKDVEYLSVQVSSSKRRYFSTQEKKAKYSDQFQIGALRLASADIQRERIESEYRLSSSFYNELLKKLEEAKFKLQQETPVFKILEPPIAAVEEVEPKRSLIIFITMIIGFIAASCFVIIKHGERKILRYEEGS
jgi:uncharacterized protein involved in exopolysaccharide biosynthesis